MLINWLTGANQAADRHSSSSWQVLIKWLIGLIKLLTGACQAAERHLTRGCVGAFQSAEWAVVKWLTGTDEVVDQALNDQQSRK